MIGSADNAIYKVFMDKNDSPVTQTLDVLAKLGELHMASLESESQGGLIYHYDHVEENCKSANSFFRETVYGYRESRQRRRFKMAMGGVIIGSLKKVFSVALKEQYFRDRPKRRPARK